MKAIAALVLVLCCVAVSHGAWRCTEAPRLYGASQIDCSVGITVASTRNYYAYMLINNRWIRLGYTRVKHVSVGPVGIWGTGTNNRVYKYLCGQFRLARGNKMRMLDCGGGKHIVGVSTVSQGSCLNTLQSFSFNGYGALSWKSVFSGLKYVSCRAYGPCWGVTTTNRVVCVKRVNPYTCLFSPWKYVAGRLAMIEISTLGKVFGVSTSGYVFKRFGITNSRPHGTRWIYIPMCVAIKHVTYDGFHLWSVSRSGLIFKCRH